MGFTPEAIRANRDYFVHKLHAQKQRNDVLHAVEDGTLGFVLLDTRGREPFASGHIPGALCSPMEELDKIMPLLPKDKEIVTYCWSHDWQLSAEAALQLAESGFLAKELNVGWKEWTYNRHPTHQGKADGFRCTCAK
jgi:rhodanese-related sulfurtransferase